MVKVLATSGATTFRLLENPFFQLYQLELAGRPYTLPNRKSLISSTLPIVHGKLIAEKDTQLAAIDGLTILLDGWKDISGNSIYALILQVFF